MKVKLHFLILILLVVYTDKSFAQGATCDVAVPFCSDASGELVFFNTTNQLNDTTIGCLQSIPNPAWYFLRINQTGQLNFNIIQWVDRNNDNEVDFGERPLDVDFIAWGPFSELYSNCTNLSYMCDNDGDGNATDSCPNNTDPSGLGYYLNNLDNTNIIDCSYSTSNIERFSIVNGAAGEFYILLITNFQNVSGKIKLEQTNLGVANSGETDCSIVVNNLPDRDVCGREPINLNGNTGGAIDYQWFVFNESTMIFEEIIGATQPILSVTTSGTYQLIVTDEDGDTTEEDVVVRFFDAPVISASPEPMIKCEMTNKQAIFDLTRNSRLVYGTQDTMEFNISYHESQADADSGDNAIVAPDNYLSASREVFVRLQRDNIANCAVTASFQITVNPAAILSDTSYIYSICENADATPQETEVTIDEIISNLVDSNGNNVSLLADTEPLTIGDYDISYHRTNVDAMTGMNPIVDDEVFIDDTILYIRVGNRVTNCFNTNNIAEVTLNINTRISLLDVAEPLEACETEVRSRIAIFDLTSYNEEVLGASPVPNGYVFTYRLTADENGAVITNPEIFEGTGSETIYVWAEDTINRCTTENIGSFGLKMNPIPTVVFREDDTVCVDAAGNLTLRMGQDLGTGFVYDWTPDNDPDGDGVENPIYTITNLLETSTFSLTVTDIGTSTVTNCSNSYAVEFRPSFPPLALDVEIQTDAFSGYFMVTGVLDYGRGEENDYEYQVDGAEFQDSPVFKDLRGGEHIMVARNKFGCGREVSKTFILLDYLRIFTPNGDGFNDVWTIKHLEDQPNAQITIFDKNGKLLQVMRPDDSWDGTYNGRQLPSSDYWFSISYIEPRTNTERVFKSHFSLKR